MGNRRLPQRFRRPCGAFLLACLAWTALASSATAADLAAGRALFQSGQYAECVATATVALDEGMDLEAWRRLQVEAELVQGRYAAALAAAELGLSEDPASIPLRLLAHTAYQYNDQPAEAAVQLQFIGQLALNARGRYWSPEARIALGRFFLKQGADARQVLEVFYDPVVKAEPELVEAHLASVELALEKYDQALAADMLDKAPAAAKEDPQCHYLRARALADSGGPAAAEALAKALEINPRHIDSLLMQAERQIDAEQYDAARETLERVLEVNPKQPIAWAGKVVLANLDGDEAAESAAHDKALSTWGTNPAVDHTIGRKLSDKYRFAEGAERQRRALTMDKSYLPARMQLAQDLLRLGEEDEGWLLATEAADADGYNVVAHNLATLHDSLSKYKVIANESFRLRMEAQEAEIYGARALELLDKAKRVLCEKYDVSIDRPISVEVFPNKQDFAVRTFGLPGAEGFLGVCFGNVITANSPAALPGVTSNWQSVLWHEFCHAVTLRKSRNKMPRWLSEGISVYEERQADPAWGEKLTPAYRELVVGGKAPKVSELSAAFLAPESPLALQFAYWESSLVIEMLVEKYGARAINAILDDLGAGMKLEDALARHAAPVNRLDGQFEAYLRERVDAWAPKAAWDECDAPRDATAADLAEWVDDNPGNYQGMIRLALAQQREKQWQESLATARKLREVVPEYTGAANAYELAARASRELGDATGEREALVAWTERDGEAVAAYERLMELGEADGQWPSVVENAERMLAVNPLSPSPYRHLAAAAEKLGRPAEALRAYRTLLEFDTADPARVHYRLAVLLADQGDRSASRRHVLQAIEEAPRYREALALLLEMQDGAASSESTAGEAAPTAKSISPPATTSSHASQLHDNSN